jgi:hypothetical protein
MGAPSTPRTTVLSRPRRILDRRLPLHHGQSLAPSTNIHLAGLGLDEASTRVQAIHPSGLPLTRSRPDRTSSRFGFPPSFAPRRPRAGQRTSGRGQATEHEPGTTRSTSHHADPPIRVAHSPRATSRRTSFSPRRCEKDANTLCAITASRSALTVDLCCQLPLAFGGGSLPATLLWARGQPVSRDQTAADPRTVGAGGLRLPSQGRGHPTRTARAIARSPKLKPASTTLWGQWSRPRAPCSPPDS